MSTIALYSTLNILETKGPPIENGLWEIEWSRHSRDQ